MKRTKVILQSLESDADAEMSASTSDESDILEYNASESLDDPPENLQASGFYSYDDIGSLASSPGSAYHALVSASMKCLCSGLIDL
ncbi:hypothetical protein AVEN_162737-1 [Araneus ventricosus]|uniref:Uncharacterized protein n=1 Tax=Araneus ventricosus TaxID=182803 RepID=A0A4Y2VG95_ARAVE|nr:hypothetical protein AVEN_162737-1 [Araneus ventricosus]